MANIATSLEKKASSLNGSWLFTAKQRASAYIHRPICGLFMQAKGGINTVNPTRLVEALIIAVATSLGVYVIAIAKMETKIETLQSSVNEIKVDVQSIKKDFYVPSNSIRYSRDGYPTITRTPDENHP